MTYVHATPGAHSTSPRFCDPVVYVAHRVSWMHFRPLPAIPERRYSGDPAARRVSQKDDLPPHCAARHGNARRKRIGTYVVYMCVSRAAAVFYTFMVLCAFYATCKNRSREGIFHIHRCLCTARVTMVCEKVSPASLERREDMPRK